MEDVTVRRMDEMEHAYGGSFVRVRASLGASAFGMNVVQLPPDSGDMAPEHDHAADGQEEVYLVLGGSGEIEAAGRVVPLDSETCVRVSPHVRRRLRSGPDGLRVLAIGGVPGAAYAPPPNSELGGPEVLLPGAVSSVLG